MVNYKNGKIYKIVSDSTDKVYIGSTTRKYLSQRFDQHKHFAQYKENCRGYRYCKSTEILRYPDAKIVLLENYSCKSKDELRAREQYYLDLYKDVCVNKKNAYGTNEDTKKKYNDEYRIKNRERINAKKAQKYECGCGGKYTDCHKSRHERTILHQNWVKSKS